VDSRFLDNVLSQEVNPDIHQLNRVQGADPHVGRRGGVSRPPGEGEADGIHGQVAAAPDAVIHQGCQVMAASRSL